MTKLFAIVTSVTNGYALDAAYVSEHFKVGDKVEVTRSEVGGFHTNVYINEFKRPFNSVHFQFVDENDEPFDIYK